MVICAISKCRTFVGNLFEENERGNQRSGRKCATTCQHSANRSGPCLHVSIPVSVALFLLASVGNSDGLMQRTSWIVLPTAVYCISNHVRMRNADQQSTANEKHSLPALLNSMASRCQGAEFARILINESIRCGPVPQNAPQQRPQMVEGRSVNGQGVQEPAREPASPQWTEASLLSRVTRVIDSGLANDVSDKVSLPTWCFHSRAIFRWRFQLPCFLADFQTSLTVPGNLNQNHQKPTYCCHRPPTIPPRRAHPISDPSRRGR